MASSKLEVDATTMAKLCGVTTGGVRLWMEKGLPHDKPTRNSLYFDLEVAIPWLVTNVWRKDDLRTEKLRAETEILQMNRDLQAGKLMVAADVQQEWSTALASLRSKLIALPTIMAARIAGSKMTHTDITTIAREAVYDALSNLAGDISEEDMIEVPDPQPKKKRGPGKPSKYDPVL